MPFFKKQDNQLVNYSEPSTAEGIAYDNTASGLTADNVQDAVDEINSNLSDRTPFIDVPAKSGNTVSEFIGALSGYLYSQGYTSGTYTFYCLWTNHYHAHGQIQFLSNGGQYAIIEVAGDLYTMDYTPNVSRNIFRVNLTQI